MGILSNIFHKIFPGSHPAAQNSSQAAPGAQQRAPQPTQQPAQQPAQQPTQQPQAAPAASAPAAAPMQQVDVEAVLNNMQRQSGQQLNWRTSIVDLLKMLDLDSSLTARKQLAQELNVHAAADGTAEQNIALMKAVWNELAKNGGKVPASLRD